MKKVKKRIDTKTSRTAEMTCLTRASSYYSKTDQYKSADYIAPKLLPGFILPVVKLSKFRIIQNLFKNVFSPKGIYEYVIARTKFIDSVFKNAVLNKFNQILIFGAGFDTRGIRFLNENTATKVFELDVPITQQAKINQFQKRKIKLHPDIIFIPINFNKESITEKLNEFGFKKNLKTLFLLEGLLMYLDKKAVNNTFKLINEFAGSGSEVIFDYIYKSVLRGENLYYGEKGIYKIVKKAKEAWTFGIEKGEINNFLKKQKLKLIQHLTSKDLEQKFFKNNKGKIIGRINETHCIVHAAR